MFYQGYTQPSNREYLHGQAQDMRQAVWVLENIISGGRHAALRVLLHAAALSDGSPAETTGSVMAIADELYSRRESHA